MTAIVMRPWPTRRVGYRRIGLERLAGAYEELAGADGEQGSVAGPDAALAGDEAAARARAARLREQPGLVGSRAVEPDREVDARRDVAGVGVQPAGSRPPERVEQDHRAT